MIVTMPWPPSELSPNVNRHWRTKARLKAKQRSTWAWLAQEKKSELAGAVLADAVAVYVGLIFNPPTKHKRDLDNCLASCKSGLDGLADALGVDDSRFKLHLCFGDVVKFGAVQVQVLPVLGQSASAPIDHRLADQPSPADS